jgi:hypothetical protein
MATMVLAACTQKGGSQAQLAPEPGLEERPQVYILRSSENQSDALLRFPAPQWPSDQAAPRVEVANVRDLAAALETLKVWNGRPVDLLILEPGAPQAAWSAAKLARDDRRRVVFWDDPNPALHLSDPRALLWQPDRNALVRYFRDFCTEPGLSKIRGCKMIGIVNSLLLGEKPGQGTEKLFSADSAVRSFCVECDSPEVWLRASFNTAELISDTLHAKDLAQKAMGQKVILGFLNPYLNFNVGPDVPQELRASIEAWSKKWVISELSK